MQRIKLNKHHALTLLSLGMLASSPAFADKPSWAGGDDDGKHGQDKHDKGHQGRGDNNANQDDDAHRVVIRFDDQQRSHVHDYYREQISAGHCPPGLAKKHNGCMPPGQAKKWTLGRQLPRDVIFHNLSPDILFQLGQAPALHRYVRVDSDILLITAATGIVIDAIQDLI